jgi:hypothetical protein
MMWFLHYRTGEVEGLRAVSTLPLAVKHACELLERGVEVGGIEGSGGLKGISADEIRAAYTERKFGWSTI